jgi:hypothetical protein
MQFLKRFFIACSFFLINFLQPGLAQPEDQAEVLFLKMEFR